MLRMNQILSVSAIIFSLLFCTNLFGQDRFERLYTTNETDVLSSSLHEIGGGYLILSLEINEDSEREFINLSRLDQKGNVDWTKEYDYDIEEDVFISELGEVEFLSDGTIAFSALLQKDSLNRLITRVDANGNVLWTFLAGNEDDQLTTGFRSNLIDMQDAGMLHITANVTDQSDQVFFSQVSLTGELIWGASWELRDTSDNIISANVKDAIYLVDSTILILGNTNSEDHQLFLTKMDTIGNILWSKSYTANLGSGLNQSALSLDEMVDSTIIVLGTQVGSSSSALLLNVDQAGNYIQSRSIVSVTNNTDLIPVEVTTFSDTTIAVALKRLDLLTNEIRPIIAKIDLDSNIYYQTLLKSSTDLNPTRGGLISPDSISPVFITSSTRVDSVRLNPYIIKLDQDGNTNCNSFVNLRYDSIFFEVDTLVWSSSPEITFDSISVSTRNFTEFNPPLLTLSDTTFCPQDPVIYTFDATTRGATSYLWEDGSTEPIRTVTETGMYTVTVIVGIEECFTLCDTGSVSQSEFPTAMIELNDANFCSSGELVLTVSSNNAIVSTLWSTGDTDRDIIVTDLTQYSVNIVDDCGNPAQAQIDLRGFAINNNPSLSISTDNLCEDNSLLIVATGPVDPALLSWSTGETMVSSIRVTEPGTYTVENLETFCPGQGSIEIVEDQFLSDVSIDISQSCDAGSNTIQLVAGGMGPIETFTWSTGANTSIINITEPGTYSVTVTNICGDEFSNSITITQEQIDDCITTPPPPVGTDCIQWPNAIYPRSNNDLNRSFGPEDMNCGNVTIEGYDLRIYNRWGNMVFESNNIGERWNGTKNNNGGELPATTYFWYASYTIEGDSFESEGDVTVIR